MYYLRICNIYYVCCLYKRNICNISYQIADITDVIGKSSKKVSESNFDFEEQKIRNHKNRAGDTDLCKLSKIKFDKSE